MLWLYILLGIVLFFAIILAVCGGIIMYVNRANIGGVFGASYEVSIEISKILPIFLVSLPFVAIT